MMEVKVVSDTKNSQGQNFGIFRQENSYTVIAKSFRLEEFGIDNPKSALEELMKAGKDEKQIKKLIIKSG